MPLLDAGRRITKLFELYATGGHSLKALTRRAYEIGLRHPRADRRMTKSEIHRMLTRLVYTSDFEWMGKHYSGAHAPLITRETFDQVQAVLNRRPRAHYPKQRHAFMGLLKCGRCGCTMTAEKKKSKYVYYRCTGFRGACGNTYIREEQLGSLLAGVIRPIQISPAIADDIAAALRATEATSEHHRQEALRFIEQRRRTITSKLDRGYEDYVSGKISDEFWTRKSEEWEAELRAVDTERLVSTGRSPVRWRQPKKF